MIIRSRKIIVPLLILLFNGGIWISIVENTASHDSTASTATNVYKSRMQHPLPLETWDQTDDGHLVCSSMLPSFGNGNPSVSWNLLKGRILNASYFPEQHAAVTKFRDWVDDLFSFYSTERLRRSVAHPASTKATRKILQVLTERLKDPSKDPVKILIMGGSVTQGLNCMANTVGLPEQYWSKPQLECAWPSRLEFLLNQVFFHGERMFEVKNLGVGGSSSETGAMVLEYQLIPDIHKPPHIVISAYSANDAKEADLDATFLRHMQDFVRASHRLRPCDDDLPLIVLADDLFGSVDERALHQTGSLYKIASWYNLMAVTYSNVARHHATANYVNETSVNHLFGSNYQIHLGLGFHIGMAWTLLFNLLVNIQETCSDIDSEGSTLTNATSSLQVPPTKYRGRIGNTENVGKEWAANTALKEDLCKSPAALSNLTEPVGYSTNVCTYAWMVNRQTSVFTPEHVNDALKDVLKSNQGWEAKGYPIKQPRTGFYTEVENSTFSLELHNVTMETRYLTILSMKSYGPAWVGSKVALSVQVIGHPSPEVQDETTRAFDTFEIDGYHETTTSVHFPHKFRLPGGGAKAGDSILVDIKLVSGQSFKIAGMAFCGD